MTKLSSQEELELEGLWEAYRQQIRVARIDDAMLIDTKTKLMWYHTNINFLPSRNWSTAEEFCQSLRVGGYNDWRLPTLQEYQELFVAKLLIISAESEQYVFWSSNRSGNAAGAYDGKALRPLNGYLALHAESKILTFVPVRTHTRDISKQAVHDAYGHVKGLPQSPLELGVPPRQQSYSAVTVMPPRHASSDLVASQFPTPPFLPSVVQQIVSSQEPQTNVCQDTSVSKSGQQLLQTVLTARVSASAVTILPKSIFAAPTVLPRLNLKKQRKEKLVNRNDFDNKDGLE